MAYSVFITIPNDLNYSPKMAIFHIEELQIKRTIYVIVLSDFSKTQLGIILRTLMLIFRDLLTLVTDIVLNIISFKSLQKFFKKKLVTLNANNSRIRPMITLQTEDNMVDLNHINQSATNKNCSTMTVKEKVARSERNSTRMVIFMSLISIFMHLMVLGSQFYQSIVFESATAIIGDVILAAGSLNNSTYTFSVLYLFNENFKKRFFKFIKFY